MEQHFTKVVLMIFMRYALAAHHQNSQQISKHPVILVVSFDGFRYDYLDKVETPTLHKLQASGVSVPYMEPVFPTKTCPNHQSIVTGLFPESHGVVGNTFFDPEYNEVLTGYREDNRFWNYHPEVVPIWISNERAGDGRVSGCLMWPGCSQRYGPNNASLPTHYFPGYNTSISWEDRVDTVISWMTNDTHPANLVFLYYHEPDSHGHSFGPNDIKTLDEIRKTDDRAAHLVKKLRNAKIFDKINLIILSDHGMHNVTQQRIINMTSIIDPNLIEGKYGRTPILQLIPKKDKEEHFLQTLAAKASLGYRVWRKTDLKNHRFHFSHSRRVLEVIIVAEVGFAFDDFESSVEFNNEKWNLTQSPTREYGVHGYDNKAPSMRPIFMAHGPAFRKGFVGKPIKNVDVVPLISEILQIPPPPNNGSLGRVVEMMETSSSTKQFVKFYVILCSTVVSYLSRRMMG